MLGLTYILFSVYIEDKKKSNTNGPMLAQSDSDVSTNIIIRRESDKVRHKQNVSDLFFYLFKIVTIN